MYDYIYTWKFNKKCRNVEVRLLHFWNGDSQGQMCYFFWIRCVGQQPEFCWCFLPFLLLLLLLLLYLYTLEYQLYRTSELLFHYFPLLSNSLLLFRAIDCFFFCLLFRFYRLFCTSHLLPLNIIDFYCFLNNIALSLSRVNIAQFS